jgi:hypothetical protein
MKITNAKRGLGLDTASYLTPYSAPMRKKGYKTAFRYLSNVMYFTEKPDFSGWFVPLSKQELAELLDDGWDVSFVQRRIGKQKLEGTIDGETSGMIAACNANGVGIPHGSSLFIDCEWAPGYVPPKVGRISFIEGKARVIVAEGYRAKLYVENTLGLSSDELYSLKGVTGYWRSAQAVPPVAIRGSQVVQSTEHFYDSGKDIVVPWDDSFYRRRGLRFDIDMLCIDGCGDRTKVVSK